MAYRDSDRASAMDAAVGEAHTAARLGNPSWGGENDRRLIVLRAVLSRWPVLAGAAVVAGLLVGGRELIRPRTFTSVGTFVVQGGRGGSSLSGIASQFGISLPTGGESGTPPALYVEVLKSRTVLTEIAHSPLCDSCAGSVLISRAMNIEGADTATITDKAVAELGRTVVASVNPKTSVVTVSAVASTPQLAHAIAQRALAATQRFNLESRQSQAGAERRFTEGRLKAVAAELSGAEQRLKDFRSANRTLGSSELQLREDQLSREVRRYDEVYTALARSLEQAKIDEVRDTPSMTMLDAPSTPLRPNPRGILLKVIFGALVGVFLAASMLAIVELRTNRTR